ncbi:hypothetical protein AVEN_164202-1 [Araneus ventricosus]|uniref:Uncharacterized protein n=1 Tax=Araneus ventricosus TaxID=182803 RepID=A0A4Y2JR25_ARAVE|nr:hypothetical protein AVEN_164202-1 [Araneus ventricosus]
MPENAKSSTVLVISVKNCQNGPLPKNSRRNPQRQKTISQREPVETGYFICLQVSALHPLGPGIQVPSLPDTVENIFFYSDTESECQIDDDVDEVYDSISDEPKLFTQSELNDLVRDLNLPRDSAEVLRSRLKEKNLLAPGTSFSWFRNRRQKFVPFVPQAGELVYCSDIPGLIASFKA